MTKEETMVIMGTLQVAYPKFYSNLNEHQAQMTVNLWANMLADVSVEDVTLAVNKFIATSKWPPSIADIRESIAQVQTGDMKDSGEAWGEVTSAISKFGYMREAEALENMSDETRQAVKYIGWKTLCMSENIMADRAHFLRIYETVQKRSIEERQIPLAIKEKIQQNIALNTPKVATIQSKEDVTEEINHQPEKVSDILRKIKMQIISKNA